MTFFVIMLVALATALVAGWVAWLREERARREAQLRKDEVELPERRLKGLRSKDRH